MMLVLSAALAGAMHVLSGPDHMAAIAPLALEQPKRSWLSGWTWGLGHSSGVVCVATLAVLFRGLLPPVAVISAWGERVVGVALIGVGLWALGRALGLASAPHAHAGQSHSHVHVRRGPAMLRRLGHAHAAFLMGIMHGVAGTSHFLGVLPALALPTRSASITYILVFGASSVVAMTGFAMCVGAAASRPSLSGPGTHRSLVMAGAAVAIFVGGVWVTGAAAP